MTPDLVALSRRLATLDAAISHEADDTVAARPLLVKRFGLHTVQSAILSATNSGFRWPRLGIIAGIAVVLGVLSAGLVLRSATRNGVPPQSIFLAARYGAILYLAAVILGAFWPKARICQDHEASWLATYFARGISRAAYVLGVYLTHAIAASGCIAVAMLAYSVTLAANGVQADFRPSPLSILWAPFGWGAFSLLIAVLIRRQNVAMLALMTLSVIPLFILFMAFFEFPADALPDYLPGVLASHLPPFPSAPLYRHLGYPSVLVVISCLAGSRLAGRYE